MTLSGDDSTEMPRNQPFDDDAIDAILSGTSREGHLADLAAFVHDVRMSAEAVPTPSPALAAALATGFSTDKGAPATTPARNVHGPARQASGLPKWRTLRMKIKGVLAGLGIAGKVALGATFAAAATTGAGAAGVLPGPVQHIVADTVGAVTPFHFDDGQGQSDSNGAIGVPDPTTTTHPSTTITTATTTTTSTTIGVTTTEPHPGGGDGAGNGEVIPPPPNGDGGHSGDGGNTGVGETPTTEHHTDGTEPVTTTTEHHGDGDGNNPQSLSIECARATNPNRIVCHWTASSSADHTYVLLRITSLSEPGRVLLQSDDALSFTDTTVTGGVGYGYRVISLRGDGTVESHSNVATIMCCGDAGSGGGDATTTTTLHHENTTTTTEHHESTTTTTHI